MKTKFILFSEIMNKLMDELLNNFIYIKKMSNLYVTKCYNILFSQKGLIFFLIKKMI